MPAQIAQHLPAQLELGCGPSIEAGIPHLSTLHRIYGVSHADYGFIYRAEADGLLALFRDPEAKYREMTEIYRACLSRSRRRSTCGCATCGSAAILSGRSSPTTSTASAPTSVCRSSRCAATTWGRTTRRSSTIRARKSLLVIGVHADRRLVQMRARRRGLRVHLHRPRGLRRARRQRDPVSGRGAAGEDLFVRATAHDAFERLHGVLA